jgi:hypothetical protein
MPITKKKLIKFLNEHFYLDSDDLCDHYLIYDESLSIEDVKDSQEAKEILINQIIEDIMKE